MSFSKEELEALIVGTTHLVDDIRIADTCLGYQKDRKRLIMLKELIKKLKEEHAVITGY